MNCESMLGGLESNSKHLGDIKVSNMFANLALMDEELASDDVSSPSHSLVPTVDIMTTFVNSQVAEDESGAKVVTASSNGLDMVQRTCGGRCLKPSQKLNDIVVHSW